MTDQNRNKGHECLSAHHAASMPIMAVRDMPPLPPPPGHRPRFLLLEGGGLNRRPIFITLGRKY